MAQEYICIPPLQNAAATTRMEPATCVSVCLERATVQRLMFVFYGIGDGMYDMVNTHG